MLPEILAPIGALASQESKCFKTETCEDNRLRDWQIIEGLENNQRTVNQFYFAAIFMSQSSLPSILLW